MVTPAPWTRDEVWAIPDSRNRYELINGELLITAFPMPIHQVAISHLVGATATYVRTVVPGMFWHAPADLSLGTDDILQPDLYFMAEESSHPGMDWRDMWPEVVIEVTSPETALLDRGIKRRRYQEAPVSEYWVVDLDARTFERWRPADGAPEVSADRLRWQPRADRPPFELNVRAFFLDLLVPEAPGPVGPPPENDALARVAGPVGILPKAARAPSLTRTDAFQFFYHIRRHELIDGVLVASPSFSPLHQFAVGRLAGRLTPYAREHGLGEFRSPPIALAFGTEELLQPDVCFLAPGDLTADRAPEEQRPLLVVEVATAETLDIDCGMKRGRYQAARVPEYWVVALDARTISRWHPDDMVPEVHTTRVTWQPDRALPPCVLDVQGYFEALLGKPTPGSNRR